MVTVKKPSEPTAPPAHGEAPPPEYGQPPSSAYSQLPPPQLPTGIPMQPSVPTKPPAHGEAPAPPQEYGQPPSSAYGQPPPPPPPTGVPMQPSLQVQGNLPGPWSTGLCDCFSDFSNCCITCWCPCITFGQIAEIVDRGSTSCGASGALYGLISCFAGCACIYSCFYRSRMRSQYMLAEEPCPDLLLHLCCESCALCQEYRELQHRGFDMNLGWFGNVDKLNQGLTMAPFVEGGMNR